ncbi:MAG: 50S ribosomal protein L11 methyltransferase [candidate division FCPU426 bacterium]
MKTILKVTFKLPPSVVDWAGQALVAYFPDGLAQTPSGRQQGWLRRHDAATLTRFRAELKSLGGRELRLQKVRQRNWVGEYQSRFPRQTIGRFVIVPSWRRQGQKIPKTSFPIYLLPGQAFGTGLHRSTQLMLKAIQRFGSSPDQHVLDVGAGSGILSFAALRQGAASALCIEIEEAAAKEIRSNARLNGFGPKRLKALCGEFPGCLKGKKVKADLLLANLVTPLLCKLMPALAAQTRAGGTLLFSGIHTEPEADQVGLAARRAGLKVVKRETKGGWWCLQALKAAS